MLLDEKIVPNDVQSRRGGEIVAEYGIVPVSRPRCHAADVVRHVLDDRGIGSVWHSDGHLSEYVAVRYDAERYAFVASIALSGAVRRHPVNDGVSHMLRVKVFVVRFCYCI